MNTRLLCLGLLIAASQLFATGCCAHPVARFRANHPCLSCGPAAHPVLHPIQTRRAILAGEPVGSVGPIGPVVGPVMSPPCHGCGSSGGPTGHAGAHFEGIPVTPTGYPPIVYPGSGYPNTGYPPIGSPIPITPGPTVIPSNQLPSPMPLPKQ